jgi:hypothetical protein
MDKVNKRKANAAKNKEERLQRQMGRERQHLNAESTVKNMIA